MCAAYYLTYLPVIFRLAVRSAGLELPEAVRFTVEWIYHSAAAINGFLYITLHSSVRNELRRYLIRCRRNVVAPALVGAGSNQLCRGRGNNYAGAPGAAVPMMTSSCQRNTEGLTTTVI